MYMGNVHIVCKLLHNTYDIIIPLQGNIIYLLPVDGVTIPISRHNFYRSKHVLQCKGKSAQYNRTE